MLVDYIVAHLLNLFCMCFGYVTRSSNFGVSYFYCLDNIILVQFSLGVQYYGVSSMERLCAMKVRMLLMSFTFPTNTSLSHHFLLLFNGSEFKIRLFDVLLRCRVILHAQEEPRGGTAGVLNQGITGHEEDQGETTTQPRAQIHRDSAMKHEK